MNYIGSKYKLLTFVHDTIEQTVGTDLSDKIFCDLFAGTGIVGRSFKTHVRKVISNDCELYSYVLNRNYIGNHREIQEKELLLEELNDTELITDGFIYQNYCLGSGSGRQYFSDYNGQKIDAIRTRIQQWYDAKRIDDSTFYFLLCSLLECADKLANTASVYGAFLKHLKQSASKDLVLFPALYAINDNEHEVHCTDANQLIKEIEGDILYLDPPYNARQYGANYHLLNTIAEYKPFVPKGKTGLRAYTRSNYCSAARVKQEFEELIKNARFKYIFLSYNNEGLMSIDDVRNIMSKYGKYDLAQQGYQRFKADKTENRNHKADSTVEYIHILTK